MEKAAHNTVTNFMIPFFTVCAHAAIQDCDYSVPKDGFIDGGDLAQFAGYYAVANPLADVDGIGGINSADVAHLLDFSEAATPSPPVVPTSCSSSATISALM